jgi:o-succinylbenzoate synthase
MVIRKVRLRSYLVPLRSTLRKEEWRQERWGLFVELTAHEGRHEYRGFGEVAPWPVPVGERQKLVVDEAVQIAQEIKDRTYPVDRDALLSRLAVEMEEVSGAVRAGFETALCSLAATMTGQPLARWLNPDAAFQVNINTVVPEFSDGGAFFRQRLEAGVRWVKVKLRREAVQEDLPRLRKIVKEAQHPVLLRLDANQAWGKEEALQNLKRLSHLPVEYVEEPLRADELSAWPEVHQKSPLVLAVDDAMRRDPEAILDWMRGGYVSVLVFKPSTLGGITAAYFWRKESQKAGARMVFSSSVEAAYGWVALLHLAAALGDPQTAAGLDTQWLFKKKLLPESLFQIRNGALTCPGGPGLGVVIPDEKVKITDEWWI